MTLDIQTLPESFDWSGAKTSPYLVEGKGQKVYWRDCWINVYEKGQSTPKKDIPKCSGWTTVSADVELEFGGQGGIIKVT
ncbi:hypothetical protein VTI28DRAFT_7182 [Corynascus sepedonium]